MDTLESMQPDIKSIRVREQRSVCVCVCKTEIKTIGINTIIVVFNGTIDYDNG